MTAAEKKRKNRFKMRMIKVGVVVACLLVIVLLGLLIRWIVVSICGNTNKLDKASISAYEKIGKSVTQITDDDSYIEKSVTERKDVIVDELEKLEDEGLINTDTIVYQEDNEMIWYEWGDGYSAGIMLSEFGEGVSGNADPNIFVTKWNSQDTSLPDEIESKIDFSHPNYPFKESDVVNLNLKAKYMFGLCEKTDTNSGHYQFLSMYSDNKAAWDKNYLSTEIDDECTVDDFKTGLCGYDIVVIEEHGNFNYAGTTMVCTLEEVKDISRYKDDLKNKYIATIRTSDGKNCYWIYPSFFEHYYGNNKLENTIIWLGCCHGYQNSDLVNAFESCGAEAVIGFTESVYTAYDYLMHTGFVYSLMWGDNVADALYFSKELFRHSDNEFFEACDASPKWYQLKEQWKYHFVPAKAKVNIKGESARLINLVSQSEQGERTIQLSAFALEAESMQPITNKDIEIFVSNPELKCTVSKKTITTTDGSVIFDITVNTNTRAMKSDITWHIDGYKDFTVQNYSFGTAGNAMNICELFFEKNENAEVPTIETPSEDIQEDEEEFLEFLEDPYEDYDYGVPLEDVIAWTYYNGHLYALYDYAVSARLMNLITVADSSVHLVTIGDANEQAAVEELIATGGRDIYYTGGLVDKSGNLYWINGETASYSNWYTGCPEYYNEEGYDDVVVIYRGAESPAENDPDFGVWIEVLEDDYSYLDFFDFDIDGITRGIVIEWDNPSEYGLAE